MCMCLQMIVVLPFHFFFRYWKVRQKILSSKSFNIFVRTQCRTKFEGSFAIQLFRNVLANIPLDRGLYGRCRPSILTQNWDRHFMILGVLSSTINHEAQQECNFLKKETTKKAIYCSFTHSKEAHVRPSIQRSSSKVWCKVRFINLAIIWIVKVIF